MNDDNLMFDTDILNDDEVFVEPRINDALTTKSIPFTAARTNIEELTLAQTLIEFKAAKPKVITTAATTVTAADTRSKGIVMQEPSETPSPKATISSY
ncbi:hypothetical protein Tco_0908502 [Tanacetum coccineum]|uniref:Uncharacterized protein n=1 Tax=Tanacetum coccineum TaxID=301880 RepID=A0ABQ5CP90_9ASTR